MLGTQYDTMEAVALQCPVCHSVPLAPRIYESCGHTVCEACMIKTDFSADSDVAVDTVPLYKCPLCRCASLQPWFARPVNHMVNNAIEAMPNYQQLKRDAAEDLTAWAEEHEGEGIDVSILSDGGVRRSIEECDDCDLAATTARQRARKSRLLVQQILPAVLRAANNGQRSVHFMTRPKELAQFVDEIAHQLYALNVHSVHATNREFSVHILAPSGNHYSQERVNPSYRPPPAFTAESD